MIPIERTPMLQALREALEVIDEFVRHWKDSEPMTAEESDRLYEKYEFARGVFLRAREDATPPDRPA